MKTLLKVLLIVLVALLVLKLLPVILGLGIGLLALLGVFVVMGFGAAGILLCVAVGLMAALAPIWLPVLALVGIVALWRRLERTA